MNVKSLIQDMTKEERALALRLLSRYGNQVVRPGEGMLNMTLKTRPRWRCPACPLYRTHGAYDRCHGFPKPLDLHVSDPRDKQGYPAICPLKTGPVTVVISEE